MKRIAIAAGLLATLLVAAAFSAVLSDQNEYPRNGLS